MATDDYEQTAEQDQRSEYSPSRGEMTDSSHVV
jgi:hypothetical protein